MGIVIGVLAAAFLLYMLIDFFGGFSSNDHIDCEIDNEIVGYDPNSGAYLVRAKNIRNITGDSPEVDGNLPANVWGYGKGLRVVDPNHAFDSPGGRKDVHHSNINWQPVKPGMEITPRGSVVRNNFLRDQVDGWDHNYIQPKGTAKNTRRR